MILEDIADLLEDESLVTQGDDFFLGNLPLEKEGIVAYYAISERPNTSFDLYYQVIDFWSRHKSHTESYNALKVIQDFLHRKANYDTENYHIYLSHSLGAIDDMDLDNERNKIFKLSVRLIYRPRLNEQS